MSAMRKLSIPLAAAVLVGVVAGCDLLRMPGDDGPSGPVNVPGNSVEEVPFGTSTGAPVESVPGLPADPTPEVPPPIY